jgi:hypothetical protein
MRGVRRWVLVPVVALCCLAATPASTAPGALVAETITRESIARHGVGGIDAVGGVGDWALSNGTICAVVTAADRSSDFSRHGGALIDLGHCGRDDDQFSHYQPMVDLGRSNTARVTAIVGKVTDGEAAIVVTGERAGIRLRTSYALGLDDPGRLRIEHRARRVGEGDRVAMFGAIALHPRGSLRAFSIDTTGTTRSRGFEHPAVDITSVRTALESLTCPDLQVLVGDPLIEPGVAYGVRLRSASLRRADGGVETLPHAVSTGENHTLFVVFARPFWVGGGGPVGLAHLGQTLAMDLRPGDEILLDAEIRLGGRNDVASVTDRLHADGELLTGRVDDAPAVVHVSRPDGDAVTQILPQADGRFSTRVPTGSYRVVARAPGGRSVEREVDVVPGGSSLEPISFDAPGRVRLPAGVAPARLVFVGLDGTPDPRFDDDLLEYGFGGELCG